MSENQGKTSDQQASEQSGEQQPERPEVQHAEAIVDRMGQRVDDWSAMIRHRVRQGIARARETGEDIYAEAQAISQKQEHK